MTATLIRVRPDRLRIRSAYPQSARDARENLGLTPAMFERYAACVPPGYKSRGGRVRRWAAPLPPIPWGIYGTNAHTLCVALVIHRRERPRAHAANAGVLDAIIRAAVREWGALPAGLEIETVAARMAKPSNA